MKHKITELLKDAAGEVTYGIRCLCGKPTPMKRLVIVLVLCGILSIAFIYTFITSIYGMGKNDVEKEFFKQEHGRKLDVKDESIPPKKKYVPKDSIQWEKVK